MAIFGPMIGMVSGARAWARVLRAGSAEEEINVGKAGTTSAPGNCFLAGTGVLLADGIIKSIEDVKRGDRVLSTNPKTGETVAAKVTALIRTEGKKHLNELHIATKDGIEKLTATREHPFWSPSERNWVLAGQLKPGMTLRTAQSDTVIVTANRPYVVHTRTYNLTIEDLHTYYVLAGPTAVLVHNSCGPEFSSPRAAFRHYMKHAFGVQFNKKGNWTGAQGHHQPDMAEFNGPGGFKAYKEAAGKFMSGGPRSGDLVSNEGTLFRADRETGYFGVLDTRGNIQTFFRPGGDLNEYMQEQQSLYGGSFVE